MRAPILYVGAASSAFYFPGKEPPHKECLGSDPNWGDLGSISLCLCAFCSWINSMRIFHVIEVLVTIPFLYPKRSENGGFQTVVRVRSGEQLPAPHFNLNLTSVLPLLDLSFTSFLPHFNPSSAGNLEPWFGNHGLQTLGLHPPFFNIM